MLYSKCQALAIVVSDRILFVFPVFANINHGTKRFWPKCHNLKKLMVE